MNENQCYLLLGKYHYLNVVLVWAQWLEWKTHHHQGGKQSYTFYYDVWTMLLKNSNKMKKYYTIS